MDSDIQIAYTLIIFRINKVYVSAGTYSQK